jgi:glycosyltransferase involved in cell wall biosynthesis
VVAARNIIFIRFAQKQRPPLFIRSQEGISMNKTRNPKLSVVVPVYNERYTIKEIVRRINNVAIDKEIIIVDDGSTDGTCDILQELKQDNLRIILKDKNEGKGAALAVGFGHVTGDVVIIQDADLEYDPQEYHQLMKPIR